MVPFQTLTASGGVQAVTHDVLLRLGLSMPERLGGGCLLGKDSKSKCNEGSSGGDVSIEKELRPQTLAARRALLERETGAMQVAKAALASVRRAPEF